MEATDVYDIAVSFAGEQREYVSAFVAACKQRGISVFYDKDMGNEWWGKNFIREQRKVYSAKTRYFMPFLSTEYLAKPIPGDEFSAAMMTAVRSLAALDGRRRHVGVDGIHGHGDPKW